MNIGELQKTQTLTFEELSRDLQTALQKAVETESPLVIRDGERKVAVLQSWEVYRQQQETIALLTRLVQGLEDIVQGRVSPLEEVMERLRQKP